MRNFTIINMRGFREFCKRGSKFDHVFFYSFLFLVDEGIEDSNTAINGPSSTRKGIAI